MLTGHRAETTEGPAAVHDEALVKRLLREELDDILRRRRDSIKDARALAEAEARYVKALRISLRSVTLV